MVGKTGILSLMISTLLICLCPAESFGTSPLIFDPLTTQSLVKVLQDPTNRAISSLNITYRHRDIATGLKIHGGFSPVPYTTDNREWYFCASDENDQKYEYKLPNEALYKSLIQLCIANEVCEMQSVTDPGFDQNESYHKLYFMRPFAWSRIGYNVRDAESEPFFEVVDFIELNFVQPALLNPVDKWWWEE